MFFCLQLGREGVFMAYLFYFFFYIMKYYIFIIIIITHLEVDRFSRY